MSFSAQPPAGYKLCPQCRQIYAVQVELCPRDQARLIVEKRILVGKYILLNRIGQSPRSEVYAAEQPQLGRMVAIKLLQCAPEILSNFDREVRSVGNVKHEHVVILYDSGLAEDGRPYIVMEYMDGEDLSRHLFRSGPMPAMRAIALWRQAVSAIAAAHRRSIVHGDIKPSNIFLTHREREYGTEEIAKVIDFAIAGPASRAAEPLAGGTARYLAPELSQGEGPTLRSDVYALGLLLLEMLTGQLPAEEDDDVRGEIGGEPGAIGQALLQKLDLQPSKDKNKDKGRPLSQQRLSPALRELIAETVRLDPMRRPADAGALLQRLRRLSEEALLGGKLAAPVASVPAHLDRLSLTKPDWPAATKSVQDKSAEPAPSVKRGPAALEELPLPEGNETPQMGVAMLTDLLHQLKREQTAEPPPPALPPPPPRTALRIAAVVLVPGFLGGMLAFLLRTSGVGAGVPVPPPGKTFVAAGPTPPPASPLPAPAAERPADLGQSPESPDLTLAPSKNDLSVVPSAVAPEAADPNALKVRFVYDEADEVTAIECTPESQSTRPAPHPAEKHGTAVEALVPPGGSCRASGPGGTKTYKYEGLAQKRPDATGYRRVHVHLSDSSESAPPPAKRSPESKSHLPKPPAPELDSGAATPPPATAPSESGGEVK